jgi:hypothetical protein
MSEENIVDVEATEVKPVPQPVINQKELNKVIKQYKRYLKSPLAEIRRLDGITNV